jgi:hypothetical protein
VSVSSRKVEIEKTGLRERGGILKDMTAVRSLTDYSGRMVMVEDNEHLQKHVPEEFMKQHRLRQREVSIMVNQARVSECTGVRTQ